MAVAAKPSSSLNIDKCDSNALEKKKKIYLVVFTFTNRPLSASSSSFLNGRSFCNHKLWRNLASEAWKNAFCGINICKLGILWKKCKICFCDPNVLTNFLIKSKKIYDIYRNNLFVFFIEKSTLEKYLHHIVFYVF